MLFFLSLVDYEQERYPLEEVYYRYNTMILHITFSILQDPQLAEDAFQETFLKLALYLNQHSLPESEKKRKRFLTVLARHTAIDFLRKQKKIEAGELPEHLAAFAPQLTPEEEIINSFSYKRLVHLIDQLSPQYAEVFHLKYFVGLKDQEIAQLLHLSPSTVRIRLARGRAQLKKQIISQRRIFREPPKDRGEEGRKGP